MCYVWYARIYRPDLHIQDARPEYADSANTDRRRRPRRRGRPRAPHRTSGKDLAPACARSTDRDQGARARTRKIFPPSFRGRGRRRASVALFAHTTHDARRRRRRGARAACETTTTTTTTVRACDADVRGAGAIPRIDDGSRWMINEFLSPSSGVRDDDG